MSLPVSATVTFGWSMPSESKLVPGPERTFRICSTRPVGPVGVAVASSGTCAPAASVTYWAATQPDPPGAPG